MLQKLYSLTWTKVILAGAIAAMGFWGWRGAQARSITLLAFDTRTGAVQWFQPLGADKDFFSRGAVAAGDTVILESAESSAPPKRSDLYRLQAFSVQTGDHLWTQPLDASLENAEVGRGYEFASNSMVDLQPTALYWQVGDELRSLDPTTGRQRWSIQRRWFNHDPNGSRIWLHLGVAATEQQIAVLQLASQQSSRQQLRILDAATGKLQRSISPPASDFVTNYGRMKQANHRVFTVGSDARQNLPSNERQSFLTAYALDIGKVGFRIPISGDISNLQIAGKSLILTHDSPKPEVPSRIMALDSQTGRLLWQRLNRELKCRDYEATWQADAQWVYLNCNLNPGSSPEASTIVALSAATGEVRWQTPINPNRHSEDWHMTISTGQVLLLNSAGQGNKSQDQVVALDRQTGKRLWTVALFGKRDSFFRDRIATNRNRLLITDDIPQWQIWLLQLNRGWYWNREIVAEKND